MADEESKVPFTEIIRSLTPEKFNEILSSSSRKARETFFHRHGVKASAAVSRLPRPGAKNEERAGKLFEILQDADDDEMAEEILRSWLLTKRAMLGAALDHLGIAHKDGLTESEDIQKFEKLSTSDIKTLAKKLDGIATKDEVALYLRFMGAPAVEKALS
ncbi:MAG: hypothetical protein HY903_12860 [Deltaproteobacteria bacterium]|nr:hypothetical protein [Deltaproteobacteria bacterium]